MTVRGDVKALQKELKTLEKKIAKLTQRIQVSAKGKASKPARRRSSARKAAVRRVAGKMTATDQVLEIIKNAEHGVDAASLMQKTGFKPTQVRNILSRIFKEGRVKRAGRGLYVAA